MKNTFFLLLLSCSSLSLFSQQRYFTKTGVIAFEAGTSIEDIDGINKSVTSVLDAGTGQIEFAVLVKGFEFKRSLMQEHFNENYMESDKYPKAIFRGNITDMSAVNFARDGSYPVTVKGTLEMHGVKKDVQTTGKFTVKGSQLESNAVFSVLLADYNIEIPGVVKDKISKDVKIEVNCSYAVLK